MPHTAWLSVIAYYAPAWKNGAYAAASDKIILWSRPHPKNGTPTNPSLGRPRDADFTEDNLYALVILSAPGDVNILSGDTTLTFSNLPAGITKISLGSRPGVIGGQLSRRGVVVSKYTSGTEFTFSPYVSRKKR
jgi:glucan endo-1,3-alpha-glucosidase